MMFRDATFNLFTCYVAYTKRQRVAFILFSMLQFKIKQFLIFSESYFHTVDKIRRQVEIN